jgi:hypothetical protein
MDLGAPNLAALLLAGGWKQTIRAIIELAMTQERHFATALQKKRETSAILAAADRSLSAMRSQLYPTCGQAG